MGKEDRGRGGGGGGIKIQVLGGGNKKREIFKLAFKKLIKNEFTHR